MQGGRLFQLLYLLQSRGRMTASDLAQILEVSTRTIRRDIDALSAAGIPLYTERGPKGGVALLPDFVLDRSVLTKAEQQEVLAGLKSMSTLSGGEAESAFRKLTALFQQPDSPLEVDFTPWGSGPTRPSTFEQLRRALNAHHLVQFSYYTSSGQKQLRQVEPMRLLYKGFGWYLEGYCHLRNAVRLFKVCRMLEVTILSETFIPRIHSAEPPPVFADLPPVHLELLFSQASAHRLLDVFSPEEILQLPDGHFFVSAYYPLGPWLEGMLLGFGDDLLVLSPPELQNALQKTAQRIADLYRKNVN